MGAISAGDLVLLRDRKDAQYSVERLYGFGFPVIWKGRVNDASIARGDQTVAYDTGVLEAGFVFANIVTDMLVFVGSAEGLDDKGRRRILSISGAEASGTFIFDWNDDVDWANNDFLTVVHFFPPWPRYPWFTITGPVFLKDGPSAALGGAGVVYSDQNEDPPPLVIMGPHYAGELVSGTLAVQLSAINSQAVADGATVSSFAWTVVPTASASFDNAAIAAPVITFTADNSKYWVTVVVTDSNGKTSIGRRSYQIGGAITEFSRGAITENYDNPSVNVSLTLTSPETTDSAAIRPVMTWADFADRTLIVITSEDHYGSTQKTITFRDAAQYADHNHILYVGYLFAEIDDLIDDGSGTVALTAVSLIQMFAYSISLTGVETPTEWFEMDKTLMTVAGNLFHLFKYHTTLLEIADWHLPFTDTVKRSANEEFGEGSLIQRAGSLIGSRLMAMTGVAMGEIWVETDLNLRDSADRTAETTTLIMTDSDVAGTKRVRVRQYGDQIRTLVDGGSSTGLLGSFAPFLSASQNIATAEGRPRQVAFSRLMLPDQTESNRLAGRVATVANGRFQEVNLELSGNYRSVFSPGDQQKIDLGNIIAGTLQANIRGYTDLEDIDVIVRSVTISFDNGFNSVSIVADILQAEGLTGVTITPPVVPPDAVDPGGDTPSFNLPPPPVFPPIPPNLAVPGAAVGIDEDDGVFWTLDSGGSWEARNGGLATAGSFGLIWDPWWFTSFGNNSSNPEDVILWWSGDGFLRRSIDAGKNWTDLTSFLPVPNNDAGDSPAPAVSDLTYKQFHASIHDFQRYLAIAEWDSDAAGDWRGWLLRTADNGVTWTQDINDGEVTFVFLFGSVTSGTANVDGIPFTCTSSFTGLFEKVAFDIEVPAGFACADFDVTFVSSTGPFGGVNAGVLRRCDSSEPWRWNVGGYAVIFSGSPWDVQHIDVAGSGVFTVTISIARTGQVSRPLGIDIEDEDATRAYLTHLIAGELILQNRDTTDLSTNNEIAIASATEAQVAARTFYLIPFAPAFFGTANFGDQVFIFGRWDDGAVKHLALSTDAGATIGGNLGDATWGTGWVGGFFATDASTYYAFVNGASRALWRSLNGGTSWTNLSALPFDVDANSVSLHADGRILIANRIAAAQMVAYADSPDYPSWTNATGTPSFPTAGGGARGIVWVT